MWDEIIAEVQKHPKLQGKELPAALAIADGDPWQRHAKQAKALADFLGENGMELPAELTQFSEQAKIAEFLRKSAGQAKRRTKE